jgi:hypothetical protein
MLGIYGERTSWSATQTRKRQKMHNASLESLTQERNRFLKYATDLDEIVVSLGGESAIGIVSSKPKSAKKSKKNSKQRAPRARATATTFVPSSAGAEGKRRSRINTKKVDYFVMEALLNKKEDFISGKNIMEYVNDQNVFEHGIDGIQMRASIKRLQKSSHVKDNGKTRAQKQYTTEFGENDIEFEETSTTTTTTTDAPAPVAKAAKKASSNEETNNDDNTNTGDNSSED